jgi:hypothetical protein
VIDEESLMLQPVLPAALAYPVMDSFPYFISKRGLFQLRSIAFASNTANRIHGYLLIGGSPGGLEDQQSFSRKDKAPRTVRSVKAPGHR